MCEMGLTDGGETTRRLRVGVFSRGIRHIPYIDALLGVESVIQNPDPSDAATLDAVAGWGYKPSAVRAQRYATRYGLELLRLEDGFLRSLGLGVAGAPPLSIIVDDIGIYYDTSRPSRITELLNGPSDDEYDPLMEPGLLGRAEYCMRLVGEAGLSKYNHAPDAPLKVGRTNRQQQVLVVDQTLGDHSVIGGGGDAEAFSRMLDAAICENPDAEVLVKTHPDVLAGKRRGYLGVVPDDPRVSLLSQDMNARSLVERVDRVYTVTSQLGLEAVIAGKRVTVFGAPFYAGWGLTDDRAPIRHARRSRSVTQLFAAAFLLYPRYRDPATGTPCAAETVIKYLALQRRWYALNSGRLFCVGFQFWKRSFVRAFLAGVTNKIHFVRSARQARRRGFGPDCRLVAWGYRVDEDMCALAAKAGVPIERMEDGFVRSLGLGSDMTAPLSLVVDSRGMYYDPRQPSDLEFLLAHADIDDVLRERARILRQRIVRLGLSKYNFGSQEGLDIAPAPGQRVVLVPGQVEDDVSIRLGCPGASTNRALLKAVQCDRPDAYVVYKPHPEVLSGNRKGTVDLSADERLWNALVTDVSVAACLAVADEVHTLTSLVGFEALLRDLPVVVYGQPFYSGWGLTQDIVPPARRQTYRCVTLDDLVAASLILYPRYIDPRTKKFTEPEVVVDYLQEQASGNTTSRRLDQPWLARQVRKLWRLIVGVGYAR